MRTWQRGFLGRAVFALLLGVWLALLPQAASAEKTDWKDKSYDFSRVRRILVYDLDFAGTEFSSSMKEHKYQQDFMEYAKKLGCEVLTYEQAWRRVSLALGVDLDKMAAANADQAMTLFQDNLTRVADAYINSRVLKWENNYYIEPERTVWEQKRVDRSYRDKNGRWVNDYYYITVPVTYPPRRVDYSRLNMSFEVYDAKTGKMIFGREDARDREGYGEHDGMYERICKAFFSEFGDKLH